MHVEKRDLEALLGSDLLTYQEAATLTGMSRSAISQAVQYHHIQFQVVGPYRLLRKSDVLRWYHARTPRGWPLGKPRKAA